MDVVTGRRILIAGASAGIGAALVRALAARGDTVFACARRADALSAVTEGDTRARSRVCDVRSHFSYASAIDRAAPCGLMPREAAGGVGPQQTAGRARS